MSITTNRERGFTIFEMLIVLVIVAMAMTLAPSIMAGLQGGRLRAASDELVWRLREARNEATRRGAESEMVIDPARQSFATTAEPGFRRLPAVVDGVDVQPASLVQRDGLVRIRFLADGTATPARITLRHGGSAGAIVIDWLTGGVRNDG